MSERHIDPFGTRIYLHATSLNELEDKLCSVPAKRPYQRYGPFMNGQAPGVTAAFFNGIEDFLASLDEEETTRDLTPPQQPARLPEPGPYEQPLVEYDYGR